MTRRVQKNINKMLRLVAFLLGCVLLVAALSEASFAQSVPIWTGSLTCQLNDQEQGAYQRQEIQTWTLTGAPRDPSQGMPVYPATWTAQAQGQLLRQQGTQATSIQWMASVPGQGGQAPPVGLAITIRASDGRLMIKQWTVNQTAPNAISGRRQLFVNGVPQGQPITFSRALQQWQFPLIEANPTDDPVTGSAQIQADAGSAELVHRYGALPPTATCQWRFTKGGVGGQTAGQGSMGGGMSNPNQSTPSGNPGAQVNGQNCESPTTVQQSFETMKADLQAQYDKLIQGTTDPNEIASLKNQEQRMIATLNNQEQRDMALASQGCLQPGNSGGNAAGGASASGSNSNPAGGAGAGAGASGSMGTSSGGAASGSAAGAGNNSGVTGSASGANPGTTSAGGAASGAAGNATGTSGSAAGGSAAGAGNNPGSGSGSGTSTGTNTSAGGAASGSAGASGNTSGSAGAGTGATGSTGSTGSGGSNGLPVAISPTHVVSMGLLTGVSPATNSGQQNVTVTLTGQLTNFVNGATTVSFTRTSQPGPSVNVNAAVLKNLSPSGPPPVQVGSVKVNSKTSATVTLSMDPSTAAGTYSITATTTTSSGTPEVVTLNNGFTVTPTPTLNMTPGTIANTGIGKNTASTQTPAAPASAKYRVTITGLMCMYHISSNDAVYAAAVVRQYDRRNNQNTMFTNLNTWVYGDTNGMQGQRKKAGTRGPGGGIGDGDLVPTDFRPGTRDTMPTPQVNNLLPLTLWEGTLTDGIDALVISPSLWINYGDNPFFITWNQNEDSFTNSMFTDSRVQNQINTQTLGTIVLDSSQTVGGSAVQSVAGDYVQAIADTVLVIPFVELQGNPSHDRPIGVADAKNSDPTSSMVLPNTTLVLTREMIEKRLGSGSWMMLPLDLKDTAHGFTHLAGSDQPGEYQMFIQIERQ
jgi:hypothetical protein